MVALGRGQRGLSRAALARRLLRLAFGDPQALLLNGSSSVEVGHHGLERHLFSEGGVHLVVDTVPV